MDRIGEHEMNKIIYGINPYNKLYNELMNKRTLTDEAFLSLCKARVMDSIPSMSVDLKQMFNLALEFHPLNLKICNTKNLKICNTQIENIGSHLYIHIKYLFRNNIKPPSKYVIQYLKHKTNIQYPYDNFEKSNDFDTEINILLQNDKKLLKEVVKGIGRYHGPDDYLDIPVLYNAIHNKDKTNNKTLIYVLKYFFYLAIIIILVNIFK